MIDDPDRVVLDQLAVTFRVPRSLSDIDAKVARRNIARSTFHTRMANAIARLLARRPATAAVTVDVSA